MKPKNVMKCKGVISSLLIIIFVIILITGIGLSRAPSGKEEKDNGWTFLGMKKDVLRDIHTSSGIIMGCIIVIHLSLNYKMLKGEMKIIFKK